MNGFNYFEFLRSVVRKECNKNYSYYPTINYISDYRRFLYVPAVYDTKHFYYQYFMIKGKKATIEDTMNHIKQHIKRDTRELLLNGYVKDKYYDIDSKIYNVILEDSRSRKKTSII